MSIPEKPIVTLLTDFGLRDYFVGSMKGVILRINPSVTIIDISHEVQPQNISEAAFILKSAYRYFPKKTIHLVIVDPGVGSSRRAVLMEMKDHYFIAPDNGVLSWVAQEDPPVNIIEITNSDYYLENEGPTFHGRDRFSPVAAWLSTGVKLSSFGNEITDYTRIRIPEPIIENEKKIHGQVICVDRYGNIITNVTRSHLPQYSPDQSLITKIGDFEIQGLKSFYAEGNGDQPNALINSSGYLEIYVYLANASKTMGVSSGDSFTLIVGPVKS